MQIAKSFIAVSKYVRKGNDYIEEGMDSQQEIDAGKSHKKILGKRLITLENDHDLAKLVNEEEH